MQHNSAERQQRWKSSLLGRLAGDFGAATISATLITPVITIIDRWTLLHGLDLYFQY
jgi:hypothetical protein